MRMINLLKKNNAYDYFNEKQKSDLKVNERFQEKLDMLALTRERRESVKALHEIYKQNSQYILDQFYARLMQQDEFREIINKFSSVERLKITFDRHFQSLFADELSLDYVFTRRKIAHTHARIGVLPNWMISAYALVNQLIIPLIGKATKGKTKETLDILLAYETLVAIDIQIIVETYIEIQGGSVVKGLGDIIDYNTKLNQIKELIIAQQSQYNEVQQANESMAELDASIEEIASSVGDVSDHAKMSLSELNNDLQALNHVAEILKATDQRQMQVAKDVEKLVEKVNSVSNVLAFIQGIADQTNLLALNASIEAARAGEFGKGFAVVAEEVRKLADETKQSVEAIKDDILTLGSITSNIVEQTKKSAAAMHSGVDETLNIAKTLTELNDTLQTQGERFEEIANSTKIQAEMSADVSERNQQIEKSSMRSKDIAFTTGSAIYQLSKKIDNFRLQTLSKNFVISQEDIIEMAITEHLLWRWKIYNMLLGFESLRSEEVQSYKDSDLGKWYFGKGRELLSNESAYKEVEAPFVKVYECAHNAVNAYNAGDMEQAEAYLQTLTEASDLLVEKLRKLQQILIYKKTHYEKV